MRKEKHSKPNIVRIRNNKNPKWEYRYLHNIHVDHDIVEKIKDTPLLMSVYGKLSPEDIENLYEEFAQDPAKNALLENKIDGDSDAYEEAKQMTDANSKIGKPVPGESKEIRDMKKKLEDLKKKNMKLKKDKVGFN